MDEQRFRQLAEQGCNRIPVARRVLADLETPLSAYLKLADGPYSFFFESVEGGEQWGRYSIIGLPCRTLLRAVGTEVTVETDGEVVERHELADPFPFIAEFKSRFRAPDILGEQRFNGGLVGYFSYDTVRYAETRIGPSRGRDDIGTPDILLMVADEIVIFDNLMGTATLVVNADPVAAGGFAAAQERLDALERRFGDKLELPPNGAGTIEDHDYHQHFPEADFKRAVERIKDYIVAGDCMQVVLSQRMSGDFSGEPLHLYRALRHLNPSPYMVFFNLEDHHVVSASPEILARVENGKITVHPLAGTRHRGATEEEDLALEQELLADEKEVAEHLMLIDLSRNDSGRVSKIGSVRVPRKMFVERYSHVMHIASTVESEILPDRSALDVLRATLPVGTLSGAPKIRAMEIIDELEPDRRGIYGGAMGYIGWNDNMDMAIAIRTAVITGGKIYVQAGAGIVADSQPDMEWEETRNKARAIMRAVQLNAASLRIDD